MTITQVGPALAITALLGATWAVPAAISAATPTPVETIAAGETKTLDGLSGDSVTFRAPEGWRTAPSFSRSSAHFEKDEQTLTLAVVDGSVDFDTTADRIVRNLDEQGVAAAFDGGKLSTRNGFAGKTCTAIIPGAEATGRCVVVHKGDVVVSVVATHHGGGATPDLATIVESFDLHEEK